MNRRRYERVPFFCKATLTVLPHGRPVVSRSIDISLGGAGIVTSGRIELGQQVALAFYLRNNRQQEAVEEVVGRIVHLRAEEDGNVVGVEFLQPLEESSTPLLTRKMLNV